MNLGESKTCGNMSRCVLFEGWSICLEGLYNK